jgi:NADP-dependent aldehyde dehydrogenase
VVAKLAVPTMLTGTIADAYKHRTRALDASLDVWINDVEGVGASLVVADGPAFLADAALRTECFGPTTVLVAYRDERELFALIDRLPGALTGTIHAAAPAAAAPVLAALRERVGRIVWNGFPTGVRVAWATHHGGPYPATTAASHTSVGAGAIMRWLRPVSYQDLPDELLPPPLQESNPWRLPRRVDGRLEITR